MVEDNGYAKCIWEDRKKGEFQVQKGRSTLIMTILLVLSKYQSRLIMETYNGKTAISRGKSNDSINNDQNADKEVKKKIEETSYEILQKSISGVLLRLQHVAISKLNCEPILLEVGIGTEINSGKNTMTVIDVLKNTQEYNDCSNVEHYRWFGGNTTIWGKTITKTKSSKILNNLAYDDDLKVTKTQNYLPDVRYAADIFDKLIKKLKDVQVYCEENNEAIFIDSEEYLKNANKFNENVNNLFTKKWRNYESGLKARFEVTYKFNNDDIKDFGPANIIKKGMINTFKIAQKYCKAVKLDNELFKVEVYLKALMWRLNTITQSSNLNPTDYYKEYCVEIQSEIGPRFESFFSGRNLKKKDLGPYAQVWKYINVKDRSFLTPLIRYVEAKQNPDRYDSNGSDILEVFNDDGNKIDNSDIFNDATDIKHYIFRRNESTTSITFYFQIQK